MFKRWMVALVVAVTAGGCGGTSGGGGGSGDAPPGPAPVVLTAIVVSPGHAGIGVGETAAFTVLGTMSDGSAQVVPVAWSIKDGAVASVNALGTVTGLAAGATEVLATSLFNPLVKGTGDVTVTEDPPVVYGADGGGIYRYPLDGGARTALPTAGGMKISVCPAPGGPYYLAGMELHKIDEAAGTTTPVFTFTGTSRHLGLVRDSAGRISTVNLGGSIVRYDPATKMASDIGSPLFAGGLIIDEDDNLYVSNLLMFAPGTAWIQRIAPDGKDEIIVESVVPGMAVGFGMTRTQDGTMYLCTMDAGSTAYIYRAADSNGDGDMLDPGEVTLASGVFSGASGTSVSGILWTGDALLVNERTIGITRLVDVDGDGLFLSGGESSSWSAESLTNGIDLTGLKLGRP